jgi:hypothetical protein
MERSHIPMHKWLLAFRLMNASKKGMSAHQLHRMLGVTYRSAWFIAHRIRLAQDDKAPSPLGGAGKFVEADETYVGGEARNRKGKIPKKEAVFSLVERGGKVRSMPSAGTAGTVDEQCPAGHDLLARRQSGADLDHAVADPSSRNSACDNRAVVPDHPDARLHVLVDDRVLRHRQSP